MGIKKKGTDKKDVIVYTMRLGKIFESKTYALATPHRIKKQPKDLKDALWIIEKTPGALKNIPRDVDDYHRSYVIDLLNWYKTAPAVVEKAKLLLDIKSSR
jgi:hypothetical protein